ncbi:hypothetical protein LS482_16060 [Sinomicrobium kalidii]|uniref:hypothetical protein n=1 Tax=Sinomicrobium kalidii TaxID=2900738 RepID=UPI001E32B2D0|nr:hypothetical protein [Sinomicrobium kalidii]UGU15187.1 hypothetical protein LS482_16060 [Sinomicrobium kalidii]
MNAEQKAQKEPKILIELSSQESLVKCEGHVGALVALLVRAFIHSNDFHTLMKEALGLYGVVGNDFKDFLNNIDRYNGNSRS